MTNFLEIIEDKIKKNIEIEKIKIIDNTDRHKTHKFFDINKRHLCLNIQSKYLNGLTRQKAQRIIMKLLEEEMKLKIHALEIKIS
jgi:BolA family transcriptional regulator, general stress-responsive regulator